MCKASNTHRDNNNAAQEWSEEQSGSQKNKHVLSNVNFVNSGETVVEGSAPVPMRQLAR